MSINSIKVVEGIFKISRTQFPHLKNGANNRISFIRLLVSTQ